MALLDGDATRVELIEVPLTGRPDPTAFTDWLAALADAHGVAGLCLDGPLGWKAPTSDALHCRRSERLLRAPGKTGLPPDGVKPATYLAFTRFSIACFERLIAAHGYVLPGQPGAPSGARFVTESFPTAAWRALGLAPLPAKAKASAAAIADAHRRFTEVTGFRIEGEPTHDQLQAAIGGVAGVAWAGGDRLHVALVGDPPVRLDGSWREGYIMVPAHPRVPLPPRLP